MSTLSIGLGALIAAGGAYLAFVQKKKAEEKITELKFTKPSSLAEIRDTWRALVDQNLGGNYREFIKTNGQAATDGEQLSPYGHVDCAYYVATVEREYEKDETSTDKDGKSTRKTTRGSEVISSQKSPAPLYVAEGDVRIALDLDGAAVDYKDGCDRFEPYENTRTYSFFGVPFTLPPSSSVRTLGFRYKEKIIPVGHPLHVVGEVRDSSGSLRIGKPTEKDKPFVVSVKSGESVVQDRESGAKTTFYLGIVLMVVGVAVAIFIK